MNPPSINAIRQSLADIKDALIDEPWPSEVDLGEVPQVPIHQPQQSDAGGLESKLPPEDSALIDEEPSIIFEVPPELDDRIIREALGQDGGSDFERLVRISGTDALGCYFPFHYQIAQHGIYLSSKGILQLAVQCLNQQYSANPREDISK